MEWIADLLNWVRTLHSDEGVRALIAWGGLSILVAIVFAETGLLAGFFLPGDSLLVTAGVVCAGAFPGLPPINIWVANVLLVIAAVVGGFMMFIYSGLLILINRKILPAPIRVRGWRLAGLVWSILLFGVLSVLTFRDQIAKLFGG